MMKNLLLLALMAMFIFACNSNESTDKENKDEERVEISSGDKRYEVESGYISYKTSMMGIDTKITQYFKDYGKIEATVTEMEMMGQKTTTRTLRKDNYIYSYSVDQKVGTKIKLDDVAANEGEMGKLDEETIEAMGGLKVGSEEILGKECAVFEVNIDDAKSKYWIWKNMILKMVASQNQMEVTMEATELKETSDFPDGIFDVPENINFTEPNLDADFDVEGAQG